VLARLLFQKDLTAEPDGILTDLLNFSFQISSSLYKICVKMSNPKINASGIATA
jgi:hypothetical protein